jgi:hypothetical protein
MIRRLIKPGKFLLVLACIVFTVPPQSFLEAVTSRNLAALLDGSQTLVEGDKTFSNFSFTAAPLNVSSQGGVLTLPAASDITVTAATGPGGEITLTFPLGLSASVGGGSTDFTGGAVALGFDVTVNTGSDVISAVTIDASVAENGPFAAAGANANVFAGATNLGFVNIGGPSDTLAIPGLQSLHVDAVADVIVEGSQETASVDEVVFTFEQDTPSAPVPEAGSLTLIVAGAGMLLARRLYRRRG